jgi:arylformamidase
MPLRRTASLAVAIAVGLASTACAGHASSGGDAGNADAAAVPAGDGCGGRGRVVRDLRYAEDAGVGASAQSLDLYLPAGAATACDPAPVVVYVHGGGFQRGDKRAVADKPAVFNDEGWAFASVNYRLVGDPAAGRGGGAYPRAEDDVARAVAWLRDHAGDYGLDPDRAVLLGHSAGAFLVSLVGTDASFLDEAVPDAGLGAVACVASIDTSYDIPARVATGGRRAEIYRAAFGDDPATWRAASPTHVVGGLDDAAAQALPGFFVLTRGSPARTGEAAAFVDAVNAAAGPGSAELMSPRGLSHAEVNRLIGRAGDTEVTPALMAFYRDCLG